VYEECDARHEAGHGDEGIDAAKRHADPPQPGGADDALAELFVAGLERKHCAGAGSLALVNLPPGRVGEAGKVDAEAEAIEKGGDEAGGGLLLVEPEGECLDAAEEEEGVEGGQAVADRVDDVGDPLGDVFAVADHGASHEVVMAGKVLGRAVVHDVGAVLQWTL
jgi:hypothetical protein